MTLSERIAQHDARRSEPARLAHLRYPCRPPRPECVYCRDAAARSGTWVQRMARNARELTR